MNSKSLRQISSLLFSTTGSRILGLVRDAAFMNFFGTGLIGSAFIIAFTIPNLFRRLLGEGALSSAFLPVFTKNWNQSSASGTQLLNQTLTRLLLYLGGGTFTAAACLILTQRAFDLPEKWETTLPMIASLLPYAVIICLAAIITAALNATGRFFIASLSPILLNLAMIASLVIGSLFWQSGTTSLAYTLCIGVLAGGALQLWLPAIQMGSANHWRPKLDLSTSDDFATVKQLFLTATSGAAILQVNALITRLIAYQHSDEAVTQLYLSSRLTELPLGVFAVAIYTVLFPLLSKFAAAGDESSFSSTCSKGIIMMLGITLPAAVGLAILAQPILALLFEWGRFDAAQVARTAPILAIYSCSIPFYALISFLTRIFHSRQEMKAPVQVSAVALVFNVAFSIGLMIPFGVKGLASATVITSLSQFIFLTMLLARRGWLGRLSILWSPIARTILASTLLAGIVLTAKTVVPIPWEATRLTLIIHLTLYISTGIITYGLAMLALRMGSFFVRPQVS